MSMRLMTVFILVGVTFLSHDGFAMQDFHLVRRRTDYACSDLQNLQDAFAYLEAQNFEGAFGWQTVKQEYRAMPWILSEVIGLRKDDHMEAWLGDPASRGGQWKVQLGLESLHPAQLEALDGLIQKGSLISPSATRVAIMQASRAYNVFGSESKGFQELKFHAPTSAWREAFYDFKVFTSLDRSFAVILSGDLRKASICLPAESYIPPATLSGAELRSAAFRFFSDIRHIDLLRCEGFLAPPALF